MNTILDPKKSTIAISSYKMTPETEEIASKYDTIIRFNIGSNEKILQTYSYYNGRTDLCGLSGFRTENFGPLDGFTQKHILFSRPKCQADLKHFFKLICIKQEFEDKLSKFASSINFIDPSIFNQFVDEYKYDHPTTGLIILYYLKKHLFIDQLDCINFYVDDDLFNSFAHTYNSYHKINLERKILKDLLINNIVI